MLCKSIYYVDLYRFVTQCCLLLLILQFKVHYHRRNFIFTFSLYKVWN